MAHVPRQSASVRSAYIKGKSDQMRTDASLLQAERRLKFAKRRPAALAAMGIRSTNLVQSAALMASRQVPRGFVGMAGEAKYVDIANAAYVCDTTGQRTHISIVPQGTTVNTRVGRKCELKYVQIRGSALAGTTGTVATWAAYLVWDEQPNKVLAAVTDILDAASSSSLPKRENVQRFKILRKWSGCFSGNVTTPAAGDVSTRLDEYVRLPKGLVVVPTTADTTGVIADIITGALIWLTVGDNAAGTGAASIGCTMRVGFSDIY